jgi:hypothetical protein
MQKKKSTYGCRHAVDYKLLLLLYVMSLKKKMVRVTGGTLCKGLNRASGTLVAGFIAVGAHKVAYMCGDKAEPVLLAIFVFLLCTYLLADHFYRTARMHMQCCVACTSCSVGGDVLAVHPGGEGAVRLRRDHLHPHLQPGGRVELPRRRAHPPRAPPLLHHRRRRRHLPLHHHLRLPGLGR